jgi:hypothetical protein
MKKFIPALALTALLVPVFVFAVLTGGDDAISGPAVPPEGPSASMSGKDIIVKWNLDRVASNITWYKISVYEHDASSPLPISSSSFSAEDIKNDKDKAARISQERGSFKRGIIYRFTVVAVLSEESVTGFGAESIPTNPITYEPASIFERPTNVVVNVSADIEKVTVTWDAPTGITGVIAKYRISVQQVDSTIPPIVFISAGTDTEFDIYRSLLAKYGGERNGTYKITVQAGNKDADYGRKSHLVTESLAPASGPAGTPTEPPSAPSVKLLSLQNPLGSATFEELIAKLIDWLLVVTLPIIVLLILYAGFLFMISGVSPGQKKNAANIVTFALIGYAIMLLAKVLVGVVTGFFA